MSYELFTSSAFDAWVEKLRDEIAKAAIVARLARLTSGNFGDARSVGEGISELRIHYGPGYRVYFRKRGRRIVLLLCGGDKSTQQRDIARAKNIADDWVTLDD
jgi:putative addiction module killer protein